MTEIDQNAVKNPSSGLYGRNPTHVDAANEAEDQSDIVKSIKGTPAKRMRIAYQYSDIDKQSPPPLAGILKIREMTEEQAISFAKSLMRTRPNIFKVRIRLGSYPNSRRISNPRTRTLDSNKPRFHTEVGEKIGVLLADKNMLVTEIKYMVDNAEPGFFSAKAEVYGTTDIKEYSDNKYFSPTIEFEFIKTS
jgi:hypothetical protein